MRGQEKASISVNYKIQAGVLFLKSPTCETKHQTFFIFFFFVSLGNFLELGIVWAQGKRRAAIGHFVDWHDWQPGWRIYV
jgi:hypothetical protein